MSLARFFAALSALVLLVGASAQAKWKEATSNHFIVYSAGSEQEIRDFTTKLEKFDFVLRAYHGVKAPHSPVKLKVYLLPNISAVEKAAGSEGVAGYYVTDARGLMMVGTRDDRRSARLSAESILLHEYTHHFMFQYFPAAYPTWYSEGFAEFWGAVDFLDKDVVEIGLPADHRFGSFWGNRWVTAGQLLGAQSYADVPEVDLLYAEGWLLVRYAFENTARQKQLQAYLKSINEGRSYGDSARLAFGDIGKLNSELFDYAGRGKFQVIRLPFKKIEPGPIAIRELSGAEDGMIEYDIRLGQGIRKSEAAQFAARVNKAAEAYPDDPHALALIAETERLAGNYAKADQAAERLLTIKPDSINGLLQKGLTGIARMKAATSRDAGAAGMARAPLEKAMKLAPQNPLVLEAYYSSFQAEGIIPPDEAQNALYTAMELAPSDEDLRYKVAADFELRGMVPQAIAIIRPMAYEQKAEESARERKRREALQEKYREAGNDKRETAREMLVRLQAKLKTATN
jgi:tetratricopeptide (TPR) repeat protein